MSYGSVIFTSLGVVDEMNDASEMISNGNIEDGLWRMVDASVDIISIPLGTYGLILNLSWEFGLRSLFQNMVHYNTNYIIIPEYYNGTLGLPSTLPYK